MEIGLSLFFLRYHSLVLKEDIPALNQNIKKRIKAAVEKRLGSRPCDYGKPLRGELKSLWSLRVGDYRALYHVQAKVVIIIQIVHRRDAYQAGILEARRRGLL